MPTLLPLLFLVAAAPAPHDGGNVPFRFYNRPGATDAMKSTEIARCRLIGTGPTGSAEPRTLTPSDSPEAFPRGAAAPVPSIEACMVTRGWRVYSLAPRERRALLRLAPEARVRALSSLTGALRPSYGRLVRDGDAVQLRDPAARQ